MKLRNSLTKEPTFIVGNSCKDKEQTTNFAKTLKLMKREED